MTTFETELPAVSSTVGVSATLGELLAAVKAADAAVSARPDMPILSHVQVTADADTNTVQVAAVDIPRGSGPVNTAKATVQAVATVSSGCVLVPSKMLLSILTAAGKRAPKRTSDAWHVAIAAQDGRAVVDVNGSEFQLTTQDATEFPHLPETDDGGILDMGTPELVRLLDAAYTASAKDDTLPILSALKLEVTGGVLSVISTDRYRLTLSDTPVTLDGDHNALVSAAWWKNTRRHLDKKQSTQLHFHTDAARNYVSLHNGGRVFSTQQVDGDYPKIRSLFPENCPIEYSLDADMLHAAAASVATAAERNTPIRLTYDGQGTLTLEAGVADGIAASQTLPYTAGLHKANEPLQVAFNPHYLLEGVKLFKGDIVTFVHTTAPKPAVLTGTTDTLRYLLMPVPLP